jgi:hypothetical protein
MRLLKSKKDVDNFVSSLDHCKGDVVMRSCDGSEEYNLMSFLSRTVAIGELCKNTGDNYEFFCMNRRDEPTMLKFYADLNVA